MPNIKCLMFEALLGRGTMRNSNPRNSTRITKRVIFPHAPRLMVVPGSFRKTHLKRQLSRLGISTEYYPENAAKNDTVS